MLNLTFLLQTLRKLTKRSKIQIPEKQQPCTKFTKNSKICWEYFGFAFCKIIFSKDNISLKIPFQIKQKLEQSDQFIKNKYRDITKNNRPQSRPRFLRPDIRRFHATDHFPYPWKHQKTKGFLMFSGAIEGEQ